MPHGRRRGWPLPAVICLSCGFLASGCAITPTTGDAKPAPMWTAKGSPARANGQTPTVQAANQQADSIQPRAILSYSIAVKNGPPGLSLGQGQAIVGPDGTAVVGAYGSIIVKDLTVAQATAVIEKHIAGAEPRYTPVVRLALVGPIQQAQALGEWSAPPRGNEASVVPGVVPWNGTKTNPAPKATPTPPVLTPAQKTVPDALGGMQWQKGPAAEELPNPRTMNPPADAGQAAPGAVDPSHPPLAPYPPVPTEGNKVTLPIYRVAPPDILQINAAEALLTQPVFGPHLVRPDGSVSIGAYGSAYVAGLTLDEAKMAIARVIYARLNQKEKTLDDVYKGLAVDVAAYNSNVYYVITDRVGFGEIVVRLPITGNETVLDAIGHVNGLPPESARGQIWVARRSADAHKEIVLPVDWCGITQHGLMTTNYQVLPGDRVFVKASRLITFNFVLGKFLAPIERLFGVTLLASQAVNSISSGGTVR